MLYFLVEDTLIVYVQFMIGFKRKTSSLWEKSFEKDTEHYVSDSIFKRLNLTTHVERLFQTSEQS